MKPKGLLDRLAGEYGVLISDLRLDPVLRSRAVRALRQLEVAKDAEGERRKALAYLNEKESMDNEKRTF